MTGALIAFGAVFIAVGCLIGFFLLRSLRLAIRSRGWPSVEGTLEKAALQRVVAMDSRTSGLASTQVDFAYSYEVDGTSYRSTRVTFSDRVVKTGGALSALKGRATEGGQVPVYYDPADPASSVLVPGPSFYNVMPFTTVFLMIGVGVALAGFGEQLLGLLKKH